MSVLVGTLESSDRFPMVDSANSTVVMWSDCGDDVEKAIQMVDSCGEAIKSLRSSLRSTRSTKGMTDYYAAFTLV